MSGQVTRTSDRELRILLALATVLPVLIPAPPSGHAIVAGLFVALVVALTFNRPNRRQWFFLAALPAIFWGGLALYWAFFA
jgi:hypothetical protein